MEERVSYARMRSWLFDLYYTYCRQKASGRQDWSEGELEISYAWHAYYNAFELPLERLMLEVLALVLAARRLPETFHRTEIGNLLVEHSLDEMLHGLPDEEKPELLHDMKLLGLV